MKKVLFIAVTAAALCSCTSHKYVIDGKIDGLIGSVYMFDDKERMLDSAAVENGVFQFQGKAEQPAMRYLSDSKEGVSPTFNTMIIVEPGVITVTDNTEVPHQKIVAGTPANNASATYWDVSRALIQEFRDTTATEQRRMEIEKEYNALARTTVESNIGNYFGAILLAQQLAYELTGSELIEYIGRFSPEMQKMEILVTLKQTAEQKAKSEVGQPYMNIEQPDAQGTTISLASVIGNTKSKYTLVDFWASWCSPCMGEVPVLKKTYDEFHTKGFEIYGVSFDKDRDKWLAAIAEHNMDWIHVSELKGFDNPAATEYAVRGIPSNFLIDAEGKIVATNLRGEALYEKIAELLQ